MTARAITTRGTSCATSRELVGNPRPYGATNFVIRGIGGIGAAGAG